MSTDHERARDLAAIEALRRADEGASLAYDVEALAALWTDDAVALPPGGAPTRGRAAIRAMLEAGRAQAPEILEYRERFEETLLGDGFAVEWGRIEGAERPAGGGAPVRSAFHVMRILRREPDGTWRVARSLFAPAPPP